MATRLLIWLPLILPAYLIRFKIGPLPTTALEIFIVMIMVMFTVAHGAAGWMNGARQLGKLRLPILAWGIASFLAVLWSPDIYQGFGLWRAYVLEPVLVLVMLPVFLAGERERKYFEYALYGLVGWVTLWAVFQFATGYGIPSPWNVAIDAGRRATGPFPFPNALALLVVPIGVWAFARGFWPVTVVALLAALLARSDGGAGALLIVCWMILLFDKRWRKLAIGVALVGALSLAALPSIRAEVWQEVSFQSWSGRVRVWMWDETLLMLRDRPITGAGLGGYPVVVAPYHGHDFVEIFQYPHNIVLNFWSETGLLGLLAFMWMMVTWVRVSRHATRDTRHEAIAVVSVIVIHGLVDVPYFKNDLAVMFFMMMFLTMPMFDRSLKES